VKLVKELEQKKKEKERERERGDNIVITIKTTPLQCS